MNNISKKSKFKKIPITEQFLTEENFINKADENQKINKDEEIKTFLLRMSNDTKRKLKKISYLTESNMNQICLKAIDDYINLNFKDIKI